MNIIRHIFAPGILVGLIVAFLLQVHPFSPAVPYSLAIKMQSDAAGRARLSWARIDGDADAESASARVTTGEQTLVFALPDARLQAFRLSPLDRQGNVRIEGATLTGPDGEIVHTFPAEAFSPVTPATVLKIEDGAVVLAGEPGGGLRFASAKPLRLGRRWVPFDAAGAARQFAIAAIATMLALAAAGLFPAGARGRFAGALARLRDNQARWPGTTLLASALLATCLSCHPVIFGGKSFVSPENGATCLYDDFPTLPLSEAEGRGHTRGVDVGAVMWAHIPYSMIQHRAIFRDHELPIWNRYTQCGSPLLGQGLSMIGDPLHWIPIAANGAAWAWDLKYCLARLLFALGTGFLVRAATGRLWLAVLLTISASFLGFFSYRFNHPALFSLCYAPWILLCWVRAARTPDRVWPWAIALALANFWELNSGTAKESAMLIAGLNFTGALAVALGDQPFWNRIARLCVMGWGCVLFLLLSAPIWLLFLDTLHHAWTNYASAKAYQIQPSLAIGLFDDLFYRQTTVNEMHFNPSANFLVLLGCIWALTDFRRLARDGVFIAIFTGAALNAAVVFGVVPPGLIARLPFIGNIQHVDNTFSCVLIIHLLAIAGFGLRSLWDRAARGTWTSNVMIATLLLTTLAAAFLGYTQAAHRSGRSLLDAGETMRFSMFFLASSIALYAGVLLMPWFVRSLRARPSFGAVLGAGLCLFLFHFRHGMWMGTKFGYYVMNPANRTNLAAPSPSIADLQSLLEKDTAPARVAGLGGVLVPGFNAVFGFEHFAGADALVNPWQRQLAERLGSNPIWDWRWVLSREEFPAARAMGDLWNIRWYLGTPGEQPRDVPGLQHVRTLDLDLYTSPTVWPRAFFSDRLIECASLDNFIALLADSDTAPFAAYVPPKPIDRLPVGKDALAGRQITPARAYQHTSNTTTFTIDAPEPGVAVLGESYERENWRVTMDGRRVDYFRVNQAFLGVRLKEPGLHTLQFKYWPRFLTPGLWLALTGVAGLSLTLLLGIFTRRPAPAA